MLSPRLHKAFFSLLRAGLWNQPSELDFSSLSAEDWAEIYREAKAQTVSGVIFAGIANAAHPRGSVPDDELLAGWTVRALRIADYNAKANKTISLLASELNARGLTPVLLKGQATALSYPDPTLRECGDIDLFFPERGVLTEARGIVGRGRKTDRKSDGSIVCHRDGVTVELHGKMFDMVNPLLRKSLREAVARYGFKTLSWPDDSSVEILTPAPVLNMLMQNLHILRHALCFGIGLRQLCDYAVCYKKLTDSEKPELSELLGSMGLSKWNNMLMSFLDNYIYGIGNADTLSPLYKIVMANGNFGFGAGSRSWKRIVSNNFRMFPSVPGESLTTLFCLLARR